MGRKLVNIFFKSLCLKTHAIGLVKKDAIKRWHKQGMMMPDENFKFIPFQ